MIYNNNSFVLDLQLFDGGAGAGAAAAGATGTAGTTGATAPVAAEQKTNRAKNDFRANLPAGVKLGSQNQAAADNTAKAKADAGAAQTQTKAEDDTVLPGAQAEESPTETWDDLKKGKYKAQYDADVQAIVQQRLKNSKQSEELLSKLAPAIEQIAKSKGLDASDLSKLDTDALVNAITKDNAYFEAKAEKLGVTAETAKYIDSVESERDKATKLMQENARQEAIKQHTIKLFQQGEALKKTFPNFDIRAELQNPTFARLTAPNSGLSVEDAYYAVHRAELQTAAMKVATQKTAEQLANSIKAGAGLPSENGISSQAQSVSTVDPRKFTKQQRDAIREAVRRGEKVSF